MVEFAPDGYGFKSAEGQGEEQADPAVKHRESIAKRAGDFVRSSFDRRRIGNAPVRGHRLAWPIRALFPGSVVADRENEVEFRRARR